MVKLLKIKRRDFFQWDTSIPILVSRTMKAQKFKLLCFQNETSFGAGNLYKDLFSIYLQPSVNKAIPLFLFVHREPAQSVCVADCY